MPHIVFDPVCLFTGPIYNVLGENIIKCAYLYSAPARGNLPPVADIVIPQEEYTEKPGSGLAEAAVGSHVRILEGYYAGEIGYITELKPQETESDEKTEAIGDRVVICIDADTFITLPVNNIELLQDEKPRRMR